MMYQTPIVTISFLNEQDVVRTSNGLYIEDESWTFDEWLEDFQ